MRGEDEDDEFLRRWREGEPGNKKDITEVLKEKDVTDDVKATLVPHWLADNDDFDLSNAFGIIDICVYNDRAIVVTWIDGSKTKAVRAVGDPFDLEAGLMVCYVKRLLKMLADISDLEPVNETKVYTSIRRHMMTAANKASRGRERMMRYQAREKASEEKRKRKLAEKDERRKAKRLEEVKTTVMEVLKELRIK